MFAVRRHRLAEGRVRLANLDVTVLGRSELVRNKRAMGRTRDPRGPGGTRRGRSMIGGRAFLAGEDLETGSLAVPFDFALTD